MTTARVDSIDTLKTFRVALIKYGEEANVALAAAESEIQRLVGWLERDQTSYWQFQIKKRQEALGRAQEALRMKKLFPDSSGRFPTPVEEEKAVRRCKAALEEAEQKLANCKKYSRLLPKALMDYKGGVNRFSTWVQSEVPNAVARIDRMVDKLEAYIALSVPTSSSPIREASLSAFGSSTPPVGSMARPVEATPGPEQSEAPDPQPDEQAPTTPGEGEAPAEPR
jgi:hypothetical protein